MARQRTLTPSFVGSSPTAPANIILKLKPKGDTMQTKAIGNIGEAKVLAALVEMNIPVYMQFGDNEPADYIILFDSKPYKVQVKTSTTYNGETVKFDLCSSNLYHQRGTTRHMYTIEEVDFFLCYDYTTDKIFLIINQGNMTHITIRYTKPKNNQVSGVRFAHQYVLCAENLCGMINKLDKNRN